MKYIAFTFAIALFSALSFSAAQANSPTQTAVEEVVQDVIATQTREDSTKKE